MLYRIFTINKISIMLYHESDYFEEDIQLAEVCKSIAHPARIQILRIIVAKQNCTVSHLVKKMNLAQSTISQHLIALKDAGIIKTSNLGVSTVLSVKIKSLKNAEKALKFLTQALDK